MAKGMVLACLVLLAVPLTANQRVRVSRRTTTYPVAVSHNQKYGAAAIRQYTVWYPSSGVSLATCPILAYIHGGGWTSSVNSQDAPFNTSVQFSALARLGWVVYSVNYSGHDLGVLPLAYTDIKGFLGALADGTVVGGNVSKIMLWGHSAGAEIALAVGLTPAATWADTEHSSTAYTLTGVVTMGATTDFTSQVSQVPGTLAAVTLALGYNPNSDTASALIMSPSGYVSSTPIPLLLLAGSGDIVAGPTQTTDLGASFATAGAGSRVTATVYTGLSHVDARFSSATDQPFLDVLAFIEARGR